jgi:meiotically up-regulated gene 157 (Mug157) protein
MHVCRLHKECLASRQRWRLLNGMWRHLFLVLCFLASHTPSQAYRSLDSATHKDEQSKTQASDGCRMPEMRPPRHERRYISAAVDTYIARYEPLFLDRRLAKLFSNTFPNTLDTTVMHCCKVLNSDGTKSPDAFIVTGDIDALWLRDSANQIAPYMRFVKHDEALRDLAVGLIARLARSVLIDSYANAFNMDAYARPGSHVDDVTTRPAYAGTRVNAMTPQIFERKWELDSLCSVLSLSSSYYEATNDASPFDQQWVDAVRNIIATMRTQQRGTDEEYAAPAYTFQRTSVFPTDTLEEKGMGVPAARIGMIKSAFRPSDDATKLPFNIPQASFSCIYDRANLHVCTCARV